jgi:hypothetical protein
MNRISRSRIRIILQETFKGYGKAMNLLGSVRKALMLETNFFYFVWVLVIRGSASALFKATLLSFVLKRPIVTKKAKRNFYQNTIPTIVLFSIKYLLRLYFEAYSPLREDFEHNATVFFLVYMVVNRFMRSLIRVVKERSLRDLETQREGITHVMAKETEAITPRDD